MRFVELLHRWLGGLIGLVLALLGLTGAILVHQDAWISPEGGSARATGPLSAIVAGVTRSRSAMPDYIIFASSEFPFHRISYGDGSGQYLDRAGRSVANWASQWERPEIWLFDLHRHLFMGHNGEVTAGVIALTGLGFVITGILLWWQRRKSFAPRLWPTRMTRSAIVRHHRDMGIIFAPLLFLSLVTGAMLALRPFALFLVSPWSSPSTIEAATAKPVFAARPLAKRPAWGSMLNEAKRRFPDAEVRVLTLPKKPGEPITLRMKHDGEWLPNGRTTLWFAPDDGHVAEARDALALPHGAQILDTIYPIHAAKVGGLLYRIAMTLSGLALVLLGTLAVWTFWLKRLRNKG